VRAEERLAGDDPVTFGDLVVDLRPEIRKRRVEVREQAAHPRLRAPHRSGVVVDEIRRQELVQGVRPPLRLELLHEAPHHRLVPPLLRSAVAVMVASSFDDNPSIGREARRRMGRTTNLVRHWSRSCCIAKIVAAARLDAPIFA
jgi:hypothetical protein